MTGECVAGGLRPRFWAAAVAGELGHIAAAVAHDAAGAGRNATTNRAAYKLGRLVEALRLSEADIEQAAHRLRAAGEATGLSEREAAAAVASGLAQGRTNPRRLPPPAGQRVPTGRAGPRPAGAVVRRPSVRTGEGRP